MELEDTFASAAGGAKEGSAKKKFGVAAAVLALIVVVIFSAGGAEEEEAAEADGVALMGAAAAVDCSNPTAQAVLQSCGASPAWNVGSGRQYADRRQQALAADGADMVGSKISLTEREQAADSLLRAARAVDLTDSPPLPSVHFFDAKPRYDASSVLPIIRAVSASVAALNAAHFMLTPQ